MDIVSTTDSNYIPYLGIAYSSICKCNPDISIHFHVITDSSVTEDDLLSLNSAINASNCQISSYTIDELLVSQFPVFKNKQPKHISSAAYYRLFLSVIIPQSIDKVLYLDCDVINVRNLHELWDIDIADYAIAAVPDMDEANLSIYRRLRYSPCKGYFNSGVLLINLKYWREHNVMERFILFLEQYPERVLYHDQDILNFVLKEEKVNIPIRFNVQEAALHEKVNISWEYDEQLQDARMSPVLIHYTTGEKPWVRGCKHPWKFAYDYFKEGTIWHSMPLKQKFKGNNNIKTRIRLFLVFLGLLEPKYRYLPLSAFSLKSLKMIR